MISSLEEAKVAQEKAEEAIKQVNKNIESANKDLTQVRKLYLELQELTNTFYDNINSQTLQILKLNN